MFLALFLQINHSDNKHYNIQLFPFSFSLLQWMATSACHFSHVVLLFGITDYLLWFITAKFFDALKQWSTLGDTEMNPTDALSECVWYQRRVLQLTQEYFLLEVCQRKIGSSHIFYCKSPLICMFNKALTSGPTG